MTTVKSLSREMKFFLLALIPIYFISVGLIIQPFDSIVTGIYEIIREPDFLITDYIAVGGMGAAFVNAGMMALISIYFVYSLGMEMDGHTITSCCLMFGFSLFGKNLMNIWAIFLGVFLYAKYHKMHLSNYIYVGIYGTSLSPIITQLMHVVELPIWQRFCVTILVGICIGFVLPPLATHSHYAHKGYSLYNVGFASGIIATVLVSTFKSFGIETEARLIWSSGNDAMLLGLLFVLFAGMSVVAVLWRGKDTLLGYEKLLATTGIGGTDYLLELGGAVTLLNMGLNGLFATFFVLAVGGNRWIQCDWKTFAEYFPDHGGRLHCEYRPGVGYHESVGTSGAALFHDAGADRRRVWNFMRRVSRFSARVGGAQCRDRVWGHEPL